jgi:hypothetical protein
MYDVVTCNFALHYFFETEKHLKMFLHNVAINLKPGNMSTLLFHAPLVSGATTFYGLRPQGNEYILILHFSYVTLQCFQGYTVYWSSQLIQS